MTDMYFRTWVRGKWACKQQAFSFQSRQGRFALRLVATGTALIFQLDSVSEENRRERKKFQSLGIQESNKKVIEREAAGMPKENSKEVVKNLKEHTEPGLLQGLRRTTWGYSGTKSQGSALSKKAHLQ